MLSVLLGVCGMFGWGIYDFLGGVLAKRIGSFAPLFWSQVAGAATIVLAAIAIRASMDLSMQSLLLAPVAGVLYCGGYLLFFKGFEKGNVSVIAATMNIWAVVTMAVAFLFMGQRLTAAQTIGAFTIIAGATLASIDWTKVREQGFQLSLGVRETLLGALFFGVYWNVSEILSEDVGWLTTTVLIKLGIVVILLVFSMLTRQARQTHDGSSRITFVLVAMGVIEVCAVAAVNYGLAIGEAILVSPIASALSVVTIVLALVFLREKISALQGLGMAMAVVGIITTAL